MRRRSRNVGARRNHHRVLAAQFQSHRNEVLGGRALDQRTHRGRTGEEQMIERQRREGGRDVGATGDHVELGRVEVLGRGRRHQIRGMRGDLRHLDHHPVAGREGRRRGQHHKVDREIPRTDHADDAERSGLDFGPQATQPRGGHQFGRTHPLRHMGSGVLDHRSDPDDLGEQRGRLGPGAVVGGHGIDERVAVVQQQRHQPIDAVAPDRGGGRPLGHKGAPLPVQHRP